MIFYNSVPGQPYKKELNTSHWFFRK